MRVRALLAGESARIIGDDVEVHALAYDSRRVQPGSLFAALVGAQADGHAFIDRAVAAGASCIVTERESECGDATQVVVPDARLALANIARQFHGDPAAAMTTVGITGTNGKTTTAHLIDTVLRAAGHQVGMVGTLGTRMPDEHKPTATGMTRGTAGND